MAPSLRSLATAAIGMMRCPQGAAAGVLVGVAVAMYKRHKSSKGPAPEASTPEPLACPEPQIIAPEQREPEKMLIIASAKAGFKHHTKHAQARLAAANNGVKTGQPCPIKPADARTTLDHAKAEYEHFLKKRKEAWAAAKDAMENMARVECDLQCGVRQKSSVLDMEVYDLLVKDEVMAEIAVVRAEAAAAWAALELKAVKAEAAWAGLGASGAAAAVIVTVVAGAADV